MAYVNCNKCKNLIVDTVVKCPYCGEYNSCVQSAQQNGNGSKRDEWIAVLVSVVVMFLIGCGIWNLFSSWWDKNDIDNKIINGVVDGVDALTDMYIDYEYDKAREEELKDRIFDALNIK